MRNIIRISFLVILLLNSGNLLAFEPLSWVELGPDNTVIARHIDSSSKCPTIKINGLEQAMQARAAATKNYPTISCETVLPAKVKTVEILGQKLALPKKDPTRLVIIGDTGCRLKLGAPAQACNDPHQWPFAKIAALAASFHPDLVIHVGDYHYREMPCPFWDHGCFGSPYGYNWATWQADFFDPARPLLTAAPWVMVRGNHEICARAGEGWFRYLDPYAYPRTCEKFTPLYSVPIGNITLYVIDSSSAEDTSAPAELVTVFTTYYDAIRHSRATTIWIATHRPLWTALFPSRAMNSTLQVAAGNNFAPSLQLLLAGHVHDFEAMNFANRPAQVIIGNSGTNLERNVIKHDLKGIDLAGQSITQGLGIQEFGYLTLEKQGSSWQGQARDDNGKVLANCQLAGREFVCKTI